MSEEDQGFTVLLDEAELSLRFVETVIGLPTEARKEGQRPVDILDAIEGISEIHADMVIDLRQCAKVAMHYFAEAVAGGANPAGGGMMMTEIKPSEGGKLN